MLMLEARDAATGRVRRYSMVIFGLTATGKTTHACHHHGLTSDGEGIEIVQDDLLDQDRIETIFRDHRPDELAHYAKAACDFEFAFPFGWAELEGVHHRGDFDLSRHQEFSSKRLEYVDQVANRRYIPYVVETSVGADRVTLALLCNSYAEESVDGESEGRARDQRAGHAVLSGRARLSALGECPSG